MAAFVHGEGLITQDEYDLMKILQYREFKDFGMQVSEIFSRHIRALRKSGIEDIINIENLGYYYGNPANVRDGFKVFSNQFISNSVLFGRVSYHLDLRIVRIDDLKIQLGVKEFDYMMRRLRGINETDEDVQGRVVPLQFVRAKFMPHKFTLTPGNRHDRVVKFTSY